MFRLNEGSRLICFQANVSDHFDVSDILAFIAIVATLHPRCRQVDRLRGKDFLFYPATFKRTLLAL